MKKTIVTAAVLASLALAGCVKAPEFKAAPESMASIEAEDNSMPEMGAAAWDASDVEYSGATSDLEELARESTQAIHDFATGNPDSPVAQLEFVKSTAKNSSNVEFSVNDALTADQLKRAAKATACAIVAEMPGTLSDGAPWLGFVTLVSTENGMEYMYSDTQLCQ